MAGPRDHLGGLLELAQASTQDERMVAWRQGIATLASAVSNRQQVPLEGLDPIMLERSVRTALNTGLIDDVGFISAPAAAAAIYELAAALPMGNERRDLGRRLIRWMKTGDASTFIAIATQLAMSSPKALLEESIRARVALCLDLPLGIPAHSDALALALISRRDVEKDWLSLPSTGALPARRLAARLLEGAAREAARRAQQGDVMASRVFQTESVRGAWNRLLEDREPLVWRHVASARGVLSGVEPSFASEIHHSLNGDLTPTEWRRGATSLAASIALDPERSSRAVMELLQSPIIQKDRGVPGALILGLPRAAESEPEAAEEVLVELVRMGGVDTAEPLLELKREGLQEGFGERAMHAARAKLRRAIRGAPIHDSGRRALLESLHGELSPEGVDGSADNPATLQHQIARALDTFVHGSPAKAHAMALEVVQSVNQLVGTLQLSQDSTQTGRSHAFRALRDLDGAVLQKATLHNLLSLETQKTDPKALLGPAIDRLEHWILEREREPIDSIPLDDLTIRMRRMQTMLHMVDAQLGDGSAEARGKSLANVRLLLRRVQKDENTTMRRLVCAAAARACDALVRDGHAEISDVLVAVALAVSSHSDLDVFAEASMVPDIERAVRAYANLQVVSEEAPPGGVGERSCIDAVVQFSEELPVACSPRVEALRAGLMDYARSLETIVMAPSIRHIVQADRGSLMQGLEMSVGFIAQLVDGARMRLGLAKRKHPSKVGAMVRLVDYALDQKLRGKPEELPGAFASLSEVMPKEILPLLATISARTLRRLTVMRADAPDGYRASFTPRTYQQAPLPQWLPPDRMLGGFYVVRPLGAGAVGSVFVARRGEERHNEKAPCVALKVPEYSGAAARTLSEQEFLQLFRDEAGALLAVPTHANLARFVTFDAGAKPKPILVMELVEGPTLERALERGDVEVGRVFDLLDGIAAGIEAMHAVGVGHLDIKPSNVILRSRPGMQRAADGEAVLVDFGLAGRHIRAGCATGEYGAPEVWSSVGQKAPPYSPMPVDVYAFACMAFEMLTARTLFTGANEVALITSHVQHDGDPELIRSLNSDNRFTPLALTLRGALRADPRKRMSIAALRDGLQKLKPVFQPLRWPLALPDQGRSLPVSGRPLS